MAKNFYTTDANGNLIQVSGLGYTLSNWIHGGDKVLRPKSYSSEKRAFNDSYAPVVSLSNTFNNQYGLNLTDAQWEDIISNYYSTDPIKGHNYPGSKAHYVDTVALEAALNEYIAALGDAPVRPEYSTFLNDAYAEIDRQNQIEFDALDELLAEQKALYDEDMSNISQNYNDMRTGLLSNQYQQNVQIMDTLQSDMSRARQNALEAGASAGIRIAGNVNALLSAQNKQSATSMDTANQLAQMMISQRNEESAARRSYQSYLQSDAASRSDLRMSRDDRATGLADRNYTSASNDYTAKQTDWDNEMALSNPFYGKVPKSKYSSGGTQ